MKILILLVRIIATGAALALGGCVLHKYEYLTEFNQIDNLIGMLPVALIAAAFACLTGLLWLKHSRERLPVTVVLTAFTILSVALFPKALIGDWWIGTITNQDGETRPDLSLYAPFADNTRAVSLSRPSTLSLSGSLPILDGATALYPVYAAFAQAVYDSGAFTDDRVICTNTRSAYEGIINGERDIIFVAAASENQRAAAREAGAELVFTPIGREAFVFLTGKDNPVTNITIQQIRNIYSGKTAHWNTLGWRDGGKIIAFQRPDGSGSQTGLQMYMGGLPVQAPQPLPDNSLIGTNSLMRQVSVKWQGVQPALGYSYRYYATAMFANPDAKLLSVDGIPPTTENIQNGAYPFIGDFYAVTNGEPQGNAKLLIEWILSEQGQYIIKETGYTPLP